MPTPVTLFEHQARSYADLHWPPDHPVLKELERLNDACGVELVRVGRHQLRATQFVGVLRVGDVVLQVLPKIDYDPAGDAEASDGSPAHEKAVRAATRNLLHLLSYTHDLELRAQQTASVQDQRSDWFEMLTRLLATELHRLLKRGVERAYVTVEDDLPVLRGRWRLERQLVRHPHVRHRFDVAYDEFSPDILLNQVFLFAVERLASRTTDGLNRRLLGDIREWMGDVYRLAAVSPTHLKQVMFTRLNERFRPTFNLARLFLEAHVLRLEAGPRQTFAFAFDMNRLFEEFVARFLLRHRRHILPPVWSACQIAAQSQGQRIYLAASQPSGQPAFRLIPDLLFRSPSGSSTFLVMDTKYKQLRAHDRQWGIAQEDVYQMLAYAVRYQCQRTLVLYPQTADSGPVRVSYEICGRPARVTIATVSLHRPLDSPDALIQELASILRPLSVPITVPEGLHHGSTNSD